MYSYFLRYQKIVTLFFFFLLLSKNSDSLASSKNSESRIINGIGASPGEFPWQVAVYFSSDTSEWFCGGALISEEWILTAAQCIENRFAALVTVGAVNLEEQNRTQLTTNEAIVHDNFNNYTLANDIGLLKLERPLTFNYYIKAIALASDPLDAGVEITVSGWGQTSDYTDRDNVLQYASLTTIGNNECDAFYGKGTISDEMLCAASYTNLVRSTCHGDSGGPAVIYDEGNPILVGIITFMSLRGCEYGDPSGFVRVAYYRDWIREAAGV